MRLARLATAVLLAAAIAAPATAAPERAAAADEQGIHSPNLTHVKQLRYAARHGSPANAGTDIEFAELTVDEERRQFALAGSYNNGLEIVGVYDCGISQGDVQVFTRDERTYVAYTADAGYGVKTASACFKDAKAMGFAMSAEPHVLDVDPLGALGSIYGAEGIGTYIADITDPRNPTTVSFIAVAKGSHNGTIAPGGNYFYNSNSELYTTAANAGIEVFDIRDLSKPKLVTVLRLPPTPGLGSESHDLTFNAAGTRAYSAALSQTVSIDTTDQAAPKILSVIVDPTINVHHQADPATLTDRTTGLKRDFLFIEDEVAGALPTGQCPNGGVHVYDITGPLENAPVKVGYWNIDEARKTTGNPVIGRSGGCTAHVFDIHEKQAIMTIAYYNGGVRVVDLSGLVGVALGNGSVAGQRLPGMRQLGFHRFTDSDTWAAKTPVIEEDGSFYLYGNDQVRGLDVYRFDASKPVSASTGTWMSPAAHAGAVAALPKVALSAETGPFCLLPKLTR
jgi:hypothetical protein